MPHIQVGIVGGGTGGSALLNLILAWPGARVAVVADLREDAPALVRARELGVATVREHRDVFSVPVDLVLEVTGDAVVLDELLRAKPPGVEVVGAGGLRFFWDLLQSLSGTRAELAQAQKMESIGLLAAGVAHDFNNLLTVIAGRIEILKRRPSRDPATSRELDLIETTAKRGALLSQQLLAFARKQPLKLEVVDVNETIEGLSTMLERLVTRRVALDLALEPALGRVRADAGQLVQMLMNLAVNARDAMPGGGRLTIQTLNVDFRVPQPGQPGSLPPGHYVALVVRDTGCGIAPETIPRIFEPFFTTKEREHGTGLGLSTVYGVVAQSGGTIQVDSRPGLGTSFAIYLPRIDGS